MSIEESKPNMRLIIASAAIGALVAGVGFYLMKRYRRRCVAHDHVDSIEKLKCKLEKLKKAAFEAQIELKETMTDTIEIMEENISEQMDSWTESLKNSLLTKDMQEALATIQSVLDKLLLFDMEAKSYEQFERARRFGQYAINMYPASWKGDLESIGERMGIEADSILMVWFSDQ